MRKMSYLKFLTLLLCWVTTVHFTAQAQLKEALQLSTLAPSLLVANSDIENYKKMHYTMSTMTYMGSYMITDSIWKAAAVTLFLGAAKELFYDAWLSRGEPLWEDMKWNALGVGQGVGFTISLKF